MEYCNDSEIAPLVQIGSMICWFVGTVLWIINCRYVNQCYAKKVHSMISFTLISGCIKHIFLYLSREYCASDYIKYYIQGSIGAFTINNCLLYATFFMISMGLSLTSDYLDRNEVNIIILAIGGIMIGLWGYIFKIYQLEIVLIITLGTHSLITYENSSYIISALKQRQQMMRVNNLTSTLETIKTKISMMRLFKKITCFLYTSNLFV